jgi:hypothetical protein
MRSDDLDTPEFLAVLCGMGLLVMLPWVAFEFAQGAQTSLSVNGTLAVVYSAVGSLLLAGAGWTYVVKRIGAPRRRDHAPDAGHHGAAVDALPRRVPAVVPRRGHCADPRGGRPVLD